MSSDKSSAPDYVATQGSVFLITSDGKTLRLPIPSDSPSDPLNWCALKRFSAVGSMTLFTIVSLILAQGTSLFLPDLFIYYANVDLKLIRIEYLSSVPSLFWGVGAFVWVPLSAAIGKRPVFIICTILLAVSTFWAALSGNVYSHFGARCLQGFSGSIAPSTLLLALIDMTYIHQRPKYIAIFWCLTTVLSNIGLAFTPFIITAGGGDWRNFYWVWFGPCLVSMGFAIIFFPETSFYRPAMAFDGRILRQSAFGTVKMYSDWDVVPGGKPNMEPQRRTRLQALTAYLRNMMVSDRNRTEGWKGMQAYCYQVLLCVFNPLIFWSLILNALIFGSMIITCATFVQILLAPPYNFSSNAVGITKLATGLGGALAYPIAGPLTAHIQRKLTRCNRGIREPEHYLPSHIPIILTCSASLALYGAGIEKKWSWQLLCLFVGLNYFTAIALFVANTLWVTESFPRWRGPALVVVGAGGYGLSFALSSGVIPWVQVAGFGKTYIQLAVVVYAVGCFGIPIYFWGKGMREIIYHRWGKSWRRKTTV